MEWKTFLTHLNNLVHLYIAGPSGPTVGAIYGQLCQASMIFHDVYIYIYIVPPSPGVDISIKQFLICIWHFGSKIYLYIFCGWPIVVSIRIRVLSAALHHSSLTLLTTTPKSPLCPWRCSRRALVMLREHLCMDNIYIYIQAVYMRPWWMTLSIVYIYKPI